MFEEIVLPFKSLVTFKLESFRLTADTLRFGNGAYNEASSNPIILGTASPNGPLNVDPGKSLSATPATSAPDADKVKFDPSAAIMDTML